MTRWQPTVPLDRLTEALESEILTAPEAEVRSLLRESVAGAEIRALRALLAEAIEVSETRAPLPPLPSFRPSASRRAR